MHNKKLSKFLSLILRHRPEALDITLDEQGWATTQEIIDKMTAKGKTVSMAEIKEVVENNDKQRFKLSEDGSQIRANQGHSLKVDLGLQPQTPPEQLFHGTAKKYLNSILTGGLKKRKRSHVHLSKDKETALTVGSRHGQPVILLIDTQKMIDKGHSFFLSENGVWLTDHVPIDCLQLIDR